MIKLSQLRLFQLYLALGLVMFILRYLRSNPEYIFFYGVIDSTFLLYNYKLMREKRIYLYYLGATVLFFVLSSFLGSEGTSLMFPFITLGYMTVIRTVFLWIHQREPEFGLFDNRWKDKFYSLFLYTISGISWIVLIVMYLDKNLK
jgi:hypothetical protein